MVLILGHHPPTYAIDAVIVVADDSRTDVYSAGLVMWEIFAGKKIWVRKSLSSVVVDRVLKTAHHHTINAQQAQYRDSDPKLVEQITNGMHRSVVIVALPAFCWRPLLLQYTIIVLLYRGEQIFHYPH